ncbi:histone-lysine N-methyltransferase, H3 lysine-36 specific-like [Salarias fasciatus]|uniref:histone-lysine N-methyltransferase, H3 lysine-36 specific-like n=1 Tax=Salarias fasciatus TaxID=181472 RepID=UPI0011767A8B|nr:histone-lysine N-methyltransferase, H3 lysine-36 specific-like [Salarias fasciatus]
MPRRRRLKPKDEALFYIESGKDKEGLDVKCISSFKGRGVFASTSFEKGDFLMEYRGELISKQECERRQRVYHKNLKAFLFEFRFDGKLWCIDAAKEDGSIGRLVNDDHINPNAKMKYLNMEGKPHLCLFATRDIDPGEEITYNYGDSDWPWRSKPPDVDMSSPRASGATDPGQCSVDRQDSPLPVSQSDQSPVLGLQPSFEKPPDVDMSSPRASGATDPGQPPDVDMSSPRASGATDPGQCSVDRQDSPLPVSQSDQSPVLGLQPSFEKPPDVDMSSLRASGATDPGQPVTESGISAATDG